MKRRYDFFVKICPKSKRSQVWVETVIYTLIAFVMIGLVLAFARPKIQELQDKAIIDQSVTMLREIESTILDMSGAGNQRILELGIKKGELKIDGTNDLIIFEMESKHTYSEPGESINDGNIVIYTDKIGNVNMVSLTRDYSNSYDLQYNGADESETLTKSAVVYKLILKNEGEENNKIIININTG